MEPLPNLSMESVTAALWARIDKRPGEVIYTLTWEDVVSTLAEEMVNQGIPPEAFNQDELEQLLEAGSDIELPWQETLEILLILAWPEPCRFETHAAGAGGESFVTTTLFWECECDERYLHPRSQEQCPACQISRAEAPDARVNEVLAQNAELPAALLTYLQQEWEAYRQPECNIDTGVGVGVYSLQEKN